MTRDANSQLDIGQIGERIVCHWLKAEGFILHSQRWHCRLGELDIVASERLQGERVLAFVEVKARRSQNWDADGLLAITPAKQKKLIKAAQMFLSHHPQFEQWPCRFDVALVQVARTDHHPEPGSLTTNWCHFGRDRLRLKRYLRDAFSLDS